MSTVINGTVKEYFTNYELSTMIQDSKIARKFDLDPIEFCVLTALVRFYNPSKGFVYPSYEQLDERLNFMDGISKEALNTLRDKGLVFIATDGSFYRYFFTRTFWNHVKTAIKPKRKPY